MLKTLMKATLGSVLTLSALLSPGLAQQAPSVDKASVLVWAQTRMYYPKPNEGDQTRSAWLPVIDFTLRGPVEAGTNLEVAYSIKGKPWIQFDLSPSPVGANGTAIFSSEGSRIPDNKGTLETGPVEVRIKAVNELSGLNAELYKGTINVKKYNPLDVKKFPNFKNKFDYYIDQDWRMPFAFMSGNWYDSSDSEGIQRAPNLNLNLWFKGTSTDADDTEAHLYYKGKHVSKADGRTNGGAGHGDVDDYNWTRVLYWFSGYSDAQPVIYYDSSSGQSHSNAFNLYANPGDYEIKILHKGSLSRSVKFSINDKGLVVDNGVSTQLNHLGSFILPVKTLKMTDRKWDQNAWKTGAFYGHPVSGFAIP